MSSTNSPMGWASGPAIDPRDVAKIAAALKRIADILDDITDKGRLHVDGLIVTQDDRPY